MFLTNEYIKKDTVEKREYQINIAKSALKENSLVVLPTGLGKTIIALILIAEQLTKDNKKILFLAPTKPLVLQHAQFLKEFLTINPEEITVFTGEISPLKRTYLWEKSKIIVSTPQVIENDLLSKKINLENFSLVIFDEAHHAVGEYSYVFISEIYKQQGKERLILGITASPGNDLTKILEVCKNLDIKNIEIRTKQDPDVKPYVHDVQIKWIEIQLPKDFAYTIQLLKKALSNRLKTLKEMNFIETASVNLVNKTNLLDAQKRIQAEIKGSITPAKALFQAATIQSEAMKIHYALELLQTQGVYALKNYFKRMTNEAKSKSSTKSSRIITTDNDVIEAIAFLNSLKIEHPKVEEISKIVKQQLQEKPDSRIIVFTHYRDTSAYISKELENIKQAKPAKFIGQAIKKEDKGLTQKQQAEIIDKFKKGEYNVLIATSVAEEGLDIPSTDLVVFYEPIPSEIRAIQRRGRTARKTAGKVIILITKGTSDEGYYWSAKRKEKRMKSELETIRLALRKKIEGKNPFENIEKIDKTNQKTLTEYQKKQENVTIIVDQREYRSNVVRNLAIKGVIIEPQQLDVGDYILSSRIGVERKSTEDFLSSLIDGKLFRQIQRLRDSYSRPILILEGENLFTHRNMNHNAIYGSLASISVDYGIPIMTTKDELETANLLSVIAKREQKEEKKAVAIRGEKTQMSLNERQQFLVEGLPNISAILARRLLLHFGSIRDIANATEEELQEVNGIGKNIASEIIRVLNSNYLDK
ncbi:MAG: DEAD/DEAH box helicase [Candidatus Thermoplasmatota archaeon]|nr:DEAD/DEAH box helicase [Candidatus Thermoplasmatota archaeon]